MKTSGMNRRIGFLSVLVLTAAAAFYAPASAQWIETPEIDKKIREGIKATYDLDFARADEAFGIVARERPDHPAGAFFLAMVDWWRILIAIEDESRDQAFYRKLEAVIDHCDRLLDKNDNDLAGLFFKGGAIGFRGRLYATRKSWFKAAGDGRDAMPIVQKAARLAPKNADVNFGLGINNYYAAVLPDRYPLLKPVMLFLPKGDRSKGIRQLKSASEKGRYANWEAMYFLVQVLSTFENKPSAALPYARMLSDEFPRNPVFQRLLGRIHVKLSDWRRAVPLFTKVLTRCGEKWTGYGPAAEREATYYLGYEAMLRNEHSAALRFFNRCVSVSLAIEDEEASGFRVLALLRSGMLHDVLNQRQEALKRYNQVLAQRDYNNSHSFAKSYKAKPYRP